MFAEAVATATLSALKINEATSGFSMGFQPQFSALVLELKGRRMSLRGCLCMKGQTVICEWVPVWVLVQVHVCLSLQACFL